MKNLLEIQIVGLYRNVCIENDNIISMCQLA